MNTNYNARVKQAKKEFSAIENKEENKEKIKQAFENLKRAITNKKNATR